MITYESICKKLGFDPLKNPPEYENSAHEVDDSQTSPFSVLTLEEELYLMPYMTKQYNQKD